MNYKPDEATLTSYLYDELSAEEHAKVSNYLETNPEAKKELEEIQSMQLFMGKLKDKEVTEPSFVYENSPTIVVAKDNSFKNILKASMAIAASISLLFIVGYFTQFRISNGANGMQLSFGNNPVENTSQETLSEEDIKTWMQETLAANNETLMGRINEVENDLNAQTQQLQTANSRQLVNYTVNQDLIDQYVSQITRENRDIILGLLEVSDRNQKQYIDEMMDDFAKFIQSQRQNDLDIIQGHLESFASNPDLNQTDDYRNSE